MTQPKSSERGSILIEALVASLIVAATVGTAFEVIGGGASRTVATDLRQRAMLVAESQLAGASLAVAFGGRSSGVDGDLAWTLDVSRAEGFAPEPLAMVTVRVAPARGGKALATLSTLRLATR